MKKLLLLSILLNCHLLSCAQANDEQELKNLIQNSFDDIFSRHDTADIGKYYTEDFILLEHGEVWNNDTIRNYQIRSQQRDSKPRRVNSFDFIEIKISGNTAWMAYHNYATLHYQDKENRDLYWLESATAIKTAEGWRLDMLHSTRAKRE